MKRILNCIPSKNTEKDWGIRAALCGADMSLFECITQSVPERVDLRADWWEIGDQRATGSCVGWASADSVLRWHFTQANKINQGEQLSVRYVWMAAKETDEFGDRPTSFIESDGTSLKAALDVARKYGVVKADVLPFVSGMYPGETDDFYSLASQMRIAAYFNLGRSQDTWRTWLDTHGPILTRLNVDPVWMNCGKSGLLDAYQPLVVYGGHAVALVGYTPDRFIVRNSWGKTWGNDGFAYASLSYAAEAFDEAYGVTI